MGSVSFLVVLLFFYFVLPVTLLKIGYDRVLPLRRHKFSFPVEFRKFYFPATAVLAFLCVIFYFLGFNLQWDIFNAALIPNYKSHDGVVTLERVANAETISFFSSLFIMSFWCGCLRAKRHKKQMERAARDGEDFFAQDQVKMIGFWQTLEVHYRKSGRRGLTKNKKKPKLTVTLDVLIEGDRLYTGTLFHLDLSDDSLKSIALKGTRRFLVPLDEVKGNDESKYDIPGEITYFNVEKIKNINIRRIEEETDSDYLLVEEMGRVFRSTRELEEAVEMALNELKKKVEDHKKDRNR